MSDYRLEIVDGCVLVFGNLPIDHFSRITKLCDDTPEDRAVLSPYLAKLAGANLAFGPQSALEKMELQYRKDFDLERFFREKLGKTQAEATPADYWLAVGEDGLSSLALFAALFPDYPQSQQWGNKAGWPYPRDPDDLRRCLLLLRQVQGANLSLLVAMRDKSAEWSALADHWQELVDTFTAEFPMEQWEERRGSAPKTYALMVRILQGECHV